LQPTFSAQNRQLICSR